MPLIYSTPETGNPHVTFTVEELAVLIAAGGVVLSYRDDVDNPMVATLKSAVDKARAFNNIVVESGACDMWISDEKVCTHD